MKKIFKKSLALAVSAALCLTALVGCLTVSAAGTATASISTANVANGSTSATITVTIGSADDQVAAARFNLVAAEGITLDTSAFDSTITNGNGYPGNGFTVISNDNMFLLEAENEVLEDDATFSIPVTIADGTTAANYAVSFGDVLEVANYGTYDSTTQTWSNDEALLTVSSTNGGVTVAEAASTEPVVDENIVFFGNSAGLSSTSIQYSFRLRRSVLEAYSDFDMILVPQKYDTTTLNLIAEPTEIVVNKANFATPGTFYSYSYTDIQLYELGLNIRYYIKAYDENGDYVARSEYFDIVPADAIKTLATTTTNAALKTVLTDVLVVGDTAAQVFGVEGSDLAAAESILTGFDTSAATPDIPKSDLTNGETFVANDSSYGLTSAFAHRLIMSATVKKVPVLTYRLQDKNQELDLDKLSMTISYTSVDSTQYSKTITGSAWTRSGNFISCDYEEISLADSSTTVTAVATYDGATVFTHGYTVETFLMNYYDNASIGSMMQALAKLGASSSALFS